MTSKPGGRTELWPSEVRRLVLEDHSRLRILLRDLKAAAEWARTGDRSRGATLLREAERFARHFFRHLEMEEAQLVPLLRTIDAWGGERARRVLDEHREQRRLLGGYVQALHDPHAELARLARDTLALIVDIESIMLHEEESVLSEDLLRDDVVTIDPMGG
ncbi:MAG: hemerythrin domain-containing protein [bacterium]|nr:hemerythrin domain-containing protein [bacterium]